MLINFQMFILFQKFIYLQHCCINMLRLFFTYFTLLLFLFPMIEKGIHAFEHEEEEHCAEYEETHLHEKHHECILCDYQVEPVVEWSSDFQLVNVIKITQQVYSYLNFKKESTRFYFSLRAPPVLG